MVANKWRSDTDYKRDGRDPFGDEVSSFGEGTKGEMPKISANVSVQFLSPASEVLILHSLLVL
jgi:hypothetical protein